MPQGSGRAERRLVGQGEGRATKTADDRWTAGDAYFVPEPAEALAAMAARARPGGTVGAYVWDYAGGVEFLRYFWEEAVASDPTATVLDESHRFARWQLPFLSALFV